MFKHIGIKILLLGSKTSLTPGVSRVRKRAGAKCSRLFKNVLNGC